ncbi:energy transducer TonB [Kaistella carnis]|uniref:energy transducer TonB n=1 Tax=Kaistella carnis TaxID=1241979 RepID=UPI0028AE737B|nr:energy transducer TonB [Kaistella carnis]
MKVFLFVFTIVCSCLSYSQENTKEAYVITERLAEFPDGGLQNFRKLIEDNFREKKVKGEGKEYCELKFVIERDGSISNITANGSNESFNKEAIRAISKIKTKWIPAKIDGQPVRYRFRIPLHLDFN